jgi:hypothetical protein
MTRYMALIFDDQTAWQEPGAAERGMQLHTDFAQDFADVLRGGDALHDQSETTVIRAQGDDFVVTDGPFAEAKEALGGYYLFDVADQAAAVEVAKRVPVLRGRIELRQIMEFD